MYNCDALARASKDKRILEMLAQLNPSEIPQGSNLRRKLLKPILNKLTTGQLRDILDNLNVKKPKSYTYEYGFGAEGRANPDKSDYLNKIIRSDVDIGRIRSAIQTLLGAAELGTAPTAQVIRIEQVKQTITPESSSRLGLIIDLIKTDYQEEVRDMPFLDERDFQNNLFMFLKGRLPNLSITDISRVPNSGDILVDGKYVIEAKYAKGNSTMDHGLFELKKYKKIYSGILIAILDVHQMKSSKIDEYIACYKEEGANVITVRGTPRQKQRKTKLDLHIH